MVVGGKMGRRETRTFHIYTRGAPSVVSHEPLHLVIPKYLGRGCFARQQQQKVSELLEANCARVRRGREEGHELGQRRRRERDACTAGRSVLRTQC